MLVRVKMRQPDPFRSDAIDLRDQLALDLVQRDTTVQAGDDERLPRAVEPSSSWTGVGRGLAGALARHRECQMDADAERGSGPTATNRVGRGWRIGKEAGACHNPPSWASKMPSLTPTVSQVVP